MSDYIKLHRSLLEWEWYKNQNTKDLFLHCLLKANWKEGKFEGKVIPRGSFVTSVNKLSLELSLTPDEIRTALTHLVKTGELTKQTTRKNTVISVVNYDFFQESSQTNPKQIPNDSQTNPNNRRNKEKEEGNNNIPPISPLERFEDFWKAYPRDGNRATAEVNYCRIFLNDCNLSEDSLVKAAENYAEYVKVLNRTGDFITKPENFLKNNYFVDFLPGQYKKPDKPKGKSTGGGNKFNQYPQREYDFDALEKELLSY